MTLFGRRSKPAPPSRERPRKHHYLFAHKVMPGLFFDDPTAFFEAFRARGSMHLWFCWDQIGKSLPKAVQLPQGSLDGRLYELDGDLNALVVTLPKPTRLPEAYYVAFVLRAAGSTAGPEVRRVITLEYSLDEHGSPITCLCEWAGEMHMNLGAGPEPTLDKFVDAVRAVLAR